MSVKSVKGKKNSLRKIIAFFGLIVIVSLSLLLYIFFAPNISYESDKEKYLLISTNSNISKLITNLDQEVRVANKSTFKLVCRLMGYDRKIRSGRYLIPNHCSNFKIVKLLLKGKQTPVRVTFNNIRTKEQLAKRLSTQLMADSASIVELLNNESFLAAYKLNPNTSISYFIPNTYEFYWDIDAKRLFERMVREYNTFWNDERKEKAAALQLNQVQVSILASIVEEETNKQQEFPIVAGLYINRLRKGMLLQADPTVKFAVGDFGLRRILYEHLKIESPYNTYKNKGLPPGPIRVASPTVIDAVLNYSHHNYIYMCAKETFNGEHNFASTWAEHKLNAQKYQRALNARKIS